MCEGIAQSITESTFRTTNICIRHILMLSSACLGLQIQKRLQRLEPENKRWYLVIMRSEQE